MTDRATPGAIHGARRKVEVEVFSDFCCPFCLIGGKHLDNAIATLVGEVEVDIFYQPFELDPAADEGGVDIRRRLLEKHGARVEEIWSGIEAVAHASGIPLQLKRQAFAYPTLAAHTLVRHAASRGTARALARAISEAYFLDAAPIADHEILAKLAEDHDIPRDEAFTILSNSDELGQTRAEALQSVRRGIRSVPTIVIAGRTTISSSQPVEALTQVIDTHST